MQSKILKNQTISHRIELQTTQRQAFLEIFNMHAKNGKIDCNDLREIFRRVGYQTSQENFEQVCEKIFKMQNQVTFEQFMDAFKVKNSQFDLRDIRNAFRLIAGDDDKYIPLSRILEMFKKNSLAEEKIKDLLNLLRDYINEKKNTFDYELFLSHLR